MAVLFRELSVKAAYFARVGEKGAHRSAARLSARKSALGFSARSIFRGCLLETGASIPRSKCSNPVAELLFSWVSLNNLRTVSLRVTACCEKLFSGLTHCRQTSSASRSGTKGQGASLIRNEEVAGSIPVSSTISSILRPLSGRCTVAQIA